MVHNYEVQSPDPNDNVILLTGAGASAYLGLCTLESLVNSDSGIKMPLNTLSSDEIIVKTWRKIRGTNKNATFEDVIAKLRTYLDAASLFNYDYVFKEVLGNCRLDSTPEQFERVWKDGLMKCYRIMSEHYGPNNINTGTDEFKNLVEFLKKLSSFNNGRLCIFSTNYDCAYQVMAHKFNDLSIITHINCTNGQFKENWFCRNSHKVKEGAPSIYVNLLHGCVAWFYKNGAPFGLTEELQADNEGLKITRNSLVNEREICIKLTSHDDIGSNPAFRLAFEEFYAHLLNCRVLLVWGHSFHDIEVLRTIKRAIERRTKELKIIYIDPYLDIGNAKQNIIDTLSRDPVGHNIEILPVRVEYKSQNNKDGFINKAIEDLTGYLNNSKRNIKRS